jgi:hypothetical protein
MRCSLAQGSPELGKLAPMLTRLARALYAKDGQTAEVSPFIYVMF